MRERENVPRDSVVHSMTGYFQGNWWVRKRAISYLFEYPPVSRLGEVGPVPIYPNRWILARIRYHNLLPVDGLLGPTFRIPVVIIFPTMTTACYNWALESFTVDQKKKKR